MRNLSLLEGRHLTVGTIDLPPYIIFHGIDDVGKNITSNSIRIDGFVHEMMEHFSTVFHFKYTYVIPRDLAFGAIVNGTWNGVIGMVMRKEVDMGASGVTLTEARRTVVDFTVPFYEDPVSLLIPYPEIDVYPLEGMAKPYKSGVWILIGLSIVACAFVLATTFRVESAVKHAVKQQSASKFQESRTTSSWMDNFWINFWSLFRVLVNADYFATKTLPVRITFGVWCFMSIILVNAYNGNLVAHLTAKSQKTLIDSIEDLVKMLSSSTKEVHFLVKKNTAYETAVLAATSGPLARVRENLIKHPENALTRDLTNVTNMVAVSKKTFAQERSAHLVRINNDFKATGKCRLSIAKKPYDISRAALPFPKASPLAPIFNQELYRLREAGLLDYWLSLYSPKPNRCLAPLLNGASTASLGNRRLSVTDDDTGHNKLTLAYLFGAFLCLAVGLSCSSLAFLYEMFSNISVWPLH